MKNFSQFSKNPTGSRGNKRQPQPDPLIAPWVIRGPLFYVGVTLTGMFGFLLSSCKTTNPNSASSNANDKVYFIVLPNAKVHGQQLRMILDTGGSHSYFTDIGAKRLGLKAAYSPEAVTAQERDWGHWLAESSQVTLGSSTFTAQFSVLASRLTPPGSFGIDGVVGWPAVQGNILFFDSSRHLVSKLEVLPAETAHWLKLRIHPAEVLALEVPLPGGGSGTVAIDSGGGAVGLPAAQFKEWREAHPAAPSNPNKYYTPGEGAVTSEQGWADEIHLGPITLTEVPVNSQTDWDAYFVDNKFAGRIGLEGLARMDLIVDGETGYAYVRPKSPSDHPPTPFDLSGALHWTLDEGVEIKIDDLLIASIQLKAIAKDYAGALADDQRALALNPQYFKVFYARGFVEFLQDKPDEAVSDFSHVLELVPDDFPAYRDRGIAREAQGDFPGALADFDEAVTLKPDGSDYSRPPIYRQLLLLRLNRPKEDFAGAIATWQESWSKLVAQFVAGSLNETDFLAAAAKGNDDNVPRHLCEAYYFVGYLRFLKGDQLGAREYWQKCVNTNETSNDTFHLAMAELKRMNSSAP